MCVALLLGQHLLSTSCLPDAGVPVGSSGLDVSRGCFLLPGFLYTGGVSLSSFSLPPCLPPLPHQVFGSSGCGPQGSCLASNHSHPLCGSPGPGHSACLLSGNCFSCFPSGGSREGRPGRRPVEVSMLPAVAGFQGLAALQGPHYLLQLPTCLWPQHSGVSMSCHLSSAFCRDLWGYPQHVLLLVPQPLGETGLKWAASLVERHMAQVLAYVFSAFYLI